MKKLTKKIWAVAMAVVMVLAMAVTAFAAETGTITITPPSDTEKDVETTYTIYKVFDAVGNGTNISYSLVSDKSTAPAGFTVDEAGNVKYTGSSTTGELTADDIAAIAAYVANDRAVATVTATGTTSVTVNNLSNGYYYITTTTGTVVTIDSTNPNASVNDKNTVPKVDKNVTGTTSYDEDSKTAIAQVGTEVPFSAEVVFGKGSKNVVFHDTMSAGLELVAGSVQVSELTADQYTIKATPDEGDTITITFADGIAEGTKAIITYSATVTSDALTKDPATNKAWVSYGDKNSITDVPEVKVYNAKLTVTKVDGNNQPLAGAGFVLKNSGGKYYKLENDVVSWVDDVADATEYLTTEDSNVVTFTGLANGEYTLVEKTTPEGYNTAADEKFTVNGANTTTQPNREQTTTVVNNAGSELPSTGGIGTTMFYVIGAILVLGAGVLLVTRRRMSAK